MARVLLGLDFDGVICDSVDECLVTAVNAAACPAGGKVVAHTDQIDARLLAGFRRWRYLVRPAEEYGALLAWLHERPDAHPTPASFAMFVRMRGDALVAFGERFFAARRTLHAADPEAWLALHRRYPEAVEGWRTLHERAEIHLVTTKDRESVRRLVDSWDLEVPDQRLWTRETFDDKADAVRRLAAAAGAAAEDVIFVDDHPGHLADVATTGATCWWASWGYWPQPDDTAPGFGPDGFPALLDLAELGGWLELGELQSAVGPRDAQRDTGPRDLRRGTGPRATRSNPGVGTAAGPARDPSAGEGSEG
jgi:phosphoglycolate phosphatase-like HAD superfamily hydrolase